MRRFWWVPLGYLPLILWLIEAAIFRHHSGTDGCTVNEGFATGCIRQGEDIGRQLAETYGGLAWGLALVVVPVTVIWTGVVALVVIIYAHWQSTK